MENIQIKNIKLEIEKTLVASTAHLSGPAEIESITSNSEFITDEFEYGIRIYIGSDDFPDSYELIDLGHSHGFCEIIDLATQNECYWIKFDSDGTKYPGLVSYDW